MGKRIENVAVNTDMAKENEERAYEQGLEAVSEAQEAKSILEGIKGMDIEEEVTAAAEVDIEAVKGDATDYMNDEVRKPLDEAGEKVEEVTDESQEQIEMNDQAIEQFDSVENFGSEQADQAKDTTQEISETFENYEESAESDLEESEEEHEQQLEEIMG